MCNHQSPTSRKPLIVSYRIISSLFEITCNTYDYSESVEETEKLGCLRAHPVPRATTAYSPFVSFSTRRTCSKGHRTTLIIDHVKSVMQPQSILRGCFTQCPPFVTRPHRDPCAASGGLAGFEEGLDTVAIPPTSAPMSR